MHSRHVRPQAGKDGLKCLIVFDVFHGDILGVLGDGMVGCRLLTIMLLVPFDFGSLLRISCGAKNVCSRSPALVQGQVALNVKWVQGPSAILI